MDHRKHNNKTAGLNPDVAGSGKNHESHETKAPQITNRRTNHDLRRRSGRLHEAVLLSPGIALIYQVLEKLRHLGTSACAQRPNRRKPHFVGTVVTRDVHQLANRLLIRNDSPKRRDDREFSLL